ncbi:KdsC family phosphatase [Amphibiibacter pelophylacis]|uniref:3-deoxy-D-manno-octulosonate 8-phosphate phosphatase n=1 Tax=Amphibiibacter pelophylacis TaxID=1799477 RepID=A0ACC6NZL9_9BURK
MTLTPQNAAAPRTSSTGPTDAVSVRWPRLWREHLQAHPVQTLIVDVDGVLTDGRIWISAEGESLKSFSVLDGQGLKLLQQAGVDVVVITGRDSAAVRRRVQDLGLAHAFYGVSDKWACARTWLEARGRGADTLAVIGDDWPDLPLIQRAAIACAPANAHEDILGAVHWVTRRAGGEGGVRELCDALLWARGAYNTQRHADCQPTLDAR